MTTFSDVFGGSSVQPADVGFRAVTLAASITTVWPPFATSANELARIMKVSASSASLTITLPDATLTSAGMDCLFDNSGANTFTVLDSAGGTVATLTAGQVKYLYLSDNSTAAGTWRVTLFGASASTLDASQLSGYGLKALNNTLNAAPVLTSISGNTTVTSADRAQVFVWAGGAGALTLPTTAGSTSDFHIEVRNQGTGTLTLTPVGGSLIDGASTVALAVNESCFVHMGTSDWHTVGRGRNTAFNFTSLTKAVTGGTTDLSLTEASNVVQTYTGALASNQIVRLPAVVQVYYISNATTNAYTLTFKCVTTGSASVTVTQGQAAVIFCDGTTVVNANTSLAGGITSLVFAAASAGAPSAAIGSSDNGFYAPGTDQVGLAINGTASGLWTALGYKSTGSGAMAQETVSTGSSASQSVDRPAGQVGSVTVKTAGVDRWKINVDATAEAGANAGSDLNLSAYNDAGSLLGTIMTVVRSTRIATFTQALVANITGYASALKSATTTVSVSAATAPTALQVLTAVNSTTATWQDNPAAQAIPTVVVKMTTGTWTCPAGVTRAKVTVVGGGASCTVLAASQGLGGAGGGATIAWVTVVPGTAYTCTVGAGGAAPSAGNTNNNGGGNSEFSGGAITLQASGGGFSLYSENYGSGGMGFFGDITVTGGGTSRNPSADPYDFSNGGGSLFSGGARYGSAGRSYGEGAGAMPAGNAGNAGYQGVVIIEY